jgi:hypothetical protein
MIAGMWENTDENEASKNSESGPELPKDAMHQQNVAAIRAAIRDMHNGDTGRPAHLVVQELRTELAAK